MTEPLKETPHRPPLFFVNEPVHRAAACPQGDAGGIGSPTWTLSMRTSPSIRPANSTIFITASWASPKSATTLNIPTSCPSHADPRAPAHTCESPAQSSQQPSPILHAALSRHNHPDVVLLLGETLSRGHWTFDTPGLGPRDQFNGELPELAAAQHPWNEDPTFRAVSISLWTVQNVRNPRGMVSQHGDPGGGTSQPREGGNGARWSRN